MYWIVQILIILFALYLIKLGSAKKRHQAPRSGLMSKAIPIKYVFLIILLLIPVLFLYFSTSVKVSKSKQNRSTNAHLIINEIHKACLVYKNDYGQWPDNLNQVKAHSNLTKIIDPWDNKAIFIPYSKQKGFGLIMTGGSDGEYNCDTDDYMVRFGDEKFTPN